jgi:hypothetical protein
MEKTEMELKILREKKVNGIITRAKAKWQVEGEKSTRYFCNLEKRHYKCKITLTFNNFLFSRFCYKWIVAIKENINMGLIDNWLSARVYFFVKQLKF